MSFGYSVGDVIAIVSLIERIVLEVKSQRAAPLHFQRLAIELDFLGQVCNQVFELRPSLSNELVHIERIRAIALQCLGPLRAFEEKMKGYENSLGLHDRECGGFRKRKRIVNQIANFKNRLHWSMIERQEVDELRAILTSEILAINTLLTMHEWSSSKNQRISNQAFASQLKRLMDTTNMASAEIKKFMVDAKIASERLEHLIKSGNLAQTQQIWILKEIENKSAKTHELVTELSNWHQNEVTGIREASHKTETQIAKLFSPKKYIEEWIQKIVDYCKNIIGMVQRNTEILLSIHGMLAKFEFLLTKAGVDLPTVIFENALGIKMLLPFQLCDTWHSFSRLLGVMFFDKPGLQLVTGGRFLIMHTETNRVINSQYWSTSVRPGDQLSMSIILERLSDRACPRCQILLPTNLISENNGTTCPSCCLWLSSCDVEYLDAGVSENANNYPIPIPPPETIRLQSSSWNGQWNSGYIREQTFSRQAKLRRKRILKNDGFKKDSASPAEEIMSFRRVHVIPYQGDILKALVEAGENLREFMLEVSAKGQSESSGDSLGFQQMFHSILADFQELRNTKVSPLGELHQRAIYNAGSRNTAILEAWIRKTSHVLVNAPFKSGVDHSQIEEICVWLEEMPRWARTFTPDLGTWPGHSIKDKHTKYHIIDDHYHKLYDHYHKMLNRSCHMSHTSMERPTALRPIYDPGFFERGGLLYPEPSANKPTRFSLPTESEYY